MLKIFINILFLYITVTLLGQPNIAYLKKALIKIETIKTAQYNCRYFENSSQEPMWEFYEQIFVNSNDTFAGASFAFAEMSQTEVLRYCYDGKFLVNYDWDSKTVEIDSIYKDTKNAPMPPVYVWVKRLLKFTVENHKDIIITANHYLDSSVVHIRIPNCNIEFGYEKPFYVKDVEEKESNYTIWFKPDLLPYKFKREMPYQTIEWHCSNIEISETENNDYNALLQIPIDFEIQGQETKISKTGELIGTKAKNWKLAQIHGDSISLSNFKNKVLVIQFTGIGCGACTQSIPFIKQIVEENKGENFEFISIETWNSSLGRMEKYAAINKFNFKFLKSTKVLIEAYKIDAVPTFFILDKNHEIKKIIVGYSKDKIETKIREAIKELL